ncbi:MAG: hypothetical protein ACMXYC_01915 [Candidatus Woesearchaeota archaeon]
MWSYSAVILPILGMHIGFLLAILSPEEMEPGLKWFTLGKSLLFAVLLSVVIWFLVFTSFFWLHTALWVLVICLVFAKIFSIEVFHELILWAFAGMMLLVHKEFFLVFFSVLFVYSIFLGTLYVIPYYKQEILQQSLSSMYLKLWSQWWGFVWVVAVIKVYVLFFV